MPREPSRRQSGDMREQSCTGAARLVVVGFEDCLLRAILRLLNGLHADVALTAVPVLGLVPVVAPAARPDLVLVGWHALQRRDPDGVARLRQARPSARVFCVGEDDACRHLAEAAGLDGFVARDRLHEWLPGALRPCEDRGPGGRT